MYHIYCEDEHAEFHLMGATFLDKLEEVLYVLWELTPVERSWRRDWSTMRTFKVSYHGLEHFNVFMSTDSKIYVVKA